MQTEPFKCVLLYILLKWIISQIKRKLLLFINYLVYI